MASGPADPPPYRELVQAAARATGATNATQLADALGLDGRNDPKTVGNWWNGTNAPNYDGTMRLLVAAGWLRFGKPKTIQLAVEPLDDEEQAEVARQLEVVDGALQRLREQLGR